MSSVGNQETQAVIQQFRDLGLPGIASFLKVACDLDLDERSRLFVAMIVDLVRTRPPVCEDPLVFFALFLKVRDRMPLSEADKTAGERDLDAVCQVVAALWDAAEETQH